MAGLQNPALLSGAEHLFLNCSGSLGTLAADTVACARIRDFVFGGGTLYASDWASDVVAAAFGDLTEFGPREGASGIVPAKVSDPYLARRLSHSIHVNFDLGNWVRIKRFPAAADVYITDASHHPLALGFRAGKGRVVFTSFHHHAQLAGPQPADEEAILEWLATLPTQHRLLLVTGQVQAQHRAMVQNQVVGQIANNRQVMPLKMGRGSGLGVFSLSWDQDDRVEFSMRYLRDREIPEAQARSSRSPLVMTVRNPGSRDGVEINRLTVGGSA